jgi:HSP20 family molecular chaperone IbpA
MTMNEKTDMTTAERSRTLPRQGDGEIELLPAVDIYENDAGITLEADLPGVSRDRLDIQIDHNNLTIEGEVAVEVSENVKPLYADVRGTRYRRSFSLSPELDTENVDANLGNGVLSLKIPKRAELQPRRIEVKAH